MLESDPYTVVLDIMSTMDLRTALLDIAEPWRTTGEEHYPGGAVRIGRVPSRGPMAYLHGFHAPASDDYIEAMEAAVGTGFHPDLRAMYGQMNGFRMFSDSMGTYGLRRTYSRTDPEVGVLPYDIDLPNATEHYRGLPKDHVVFGYYSVGAHVAITPTGAVFAFVSNDWTSRLGEWRSIFDWATSEARRLSGCFARDGSILVPDEATLPGATAS